MSILMRGEWAAVQQVMNECLQFVNVIQSELLLFLLVKPTTLFMAMSAKLIA